MSEKQEDNIIEFPHKVTDEEFEMFINALLGPYKGGYCPE